MFMRLALVLFVAAACAGCHDNDRLRPTNVFATSSVPPPVAFAASSTAPGTIAAAPAASSRNAVVDSGPAHLMTDAELGALVSSVSEATGEFPSDNFVSNETTLMDVAPVLTRDALRGRAYVGVGPEQNLTYARSMHATIAYVVDIRRQNMLELMAMRASMEASETRAAFFSRWTSRRDVSDKLSDSKRASVEDIARAIDAAPVDPAVAASLRHATRSLMSRLGIQEQPGDDRGIDAVLAAFAATGMNLAYSMKGSGRRYPALREVLSLVGPGDEGSFAKTEESYAEVRRMMTQNRIVPVVGDFAGTKALRGVAQDMSRRGLVLGVFYVSNVEQYLFEDGTYGRFVSNVEALPKDDESVFVRVWFDQGRAHPKQRKGQRTATLAMSISHFLRRCRASPYRSFWEVATDDAAMVR